MASVSLEERIMSAPGHHVKAVLLSVCSDTEVKNHVVSRLDALTQFESAGETNRKRKADDDLAVCVQCEDPFFKDDNPFGSCFYHTGRHETDPYKAYRESEEDQEDSEEDLEDSEEDQGDSE
ncbi:hypothetical protein AAL_00868 [Moelleriella libera RCEF 2490]|uniref:Uncharacterized protein n=1 Tax=Moelleriella libera RCEF 2490 TaxID=1081109 RepID=A0A166V8Z2_9HYPO|nr:hypothetical protein AAL_00868 [Moelleriella libera RCEF 2490]